MNVVKATDSVTIKVKKAELFEDKWLNFQLLSKKLGDIEKKNNMAYKALRNKFYNSRACGKYNMTDIAGLQCINVIEPMKGVASLVLDFQVV